MSKGDDRAAFEKWILDTYMDYKPTWDDERNCYVRFEVHLAWNAWQARGQQEPLTETALFRAARAVVSHWNEFGPEYEFERPVSMLEIAIEREVNR